MSVYCFCSMLRTIKTSVSDYDLLCDRYLTCFAVTKGYTKGPTSQVVNYLLCLACQKPEDYYKN